LLSDYGINPVNYGIKYVYDDPRITRTSGGNGVKVAVLDTGVTAHPDIVNRIKYCHDVTTGANTCDDTSTFGGGHGTLVASVIVADSGPDGLGMWGMAPEADLYAIKVCSGNTCLDTDITAGIYDAVNQNVNIISISLAGASMSTAMKDALDYADANNILIVAGAGNLPQFTSVGYPAAYYKVVSVGGITKYYLPDTTVASGINDGDYIREEKEIEFAAPSTGILAATKGGCYGYPGGTSLSTPHVSGLAAKIWDGNAVTTRLKLQLSAMRFRMDLGAPGDDSATGFGLPNLPLTGPLKNNARAEPE
jgi:subtilisin